MNLFEDEQEDENRNVIQKAEETWSAFQKRFKETWQPIDTARDVQLKIDDLQMKDQADEYIHDFQLLTMETRYDNQALTKIFREGLPLTLQLKILNCPEEALTKLDNWYKMAIHYDNQFKMTEVATEK
ncbi:hypothetical protein WG66_001916 [Moniliophthora roreri]|nr:hypothetical protein WG66_001916 [Moniliophthora roreri]